MTLLWSFFYQSPCTILSFIPLIGQEIAMPKCQPLRIIFKMLWIILMHCYEIPMHKISRTACDGSIGEIYEGRSANDRANKI